MNNEIELFIDNTSKEISLEVDNSSKEISLEVDKSSREISLEVDKSSREISLEINYLGKQGPQGPQGPQGDVGPQGPQGVPGVTPDLSGYFKLDQTTPQTIAGGIPLLTNLTPSNDYDISTKKYVDDSIALAIIDSWAGSY